MLEIKNRKLTRDAFEWQRKIVLGQWATGKDVSFDEAVKYQQAIPVEKRSSLPPFTSPIGLISTALEGAATLRPPPS